MQKRDRIKIEIAVDLDPFPGVFHTEHSARQAVAGILLSAIGHYNPTVLLASEEEQPAQEDLSFMSAEQRLRDRALKIAMERHPEADIYALKRHARKYAEFIGSNF
jgi:hypothetical protein